MADVLVGFPFWALHFDAQGSLRSPDADQFSNEVAANNLTDLFVFSHGWNNDEATAMQMYEGFFGQARAIINNPAIPQRPGAKMGVAGVIWPSILFPGDTAAPANGGGGAVSFSPIQPAGTLASELPKVFTKPAQQQDLQDLLTLLDQRSPDNDSLFAFRDKLSSLMKMGADENTTPSGQDDLELQTATVENNDQWLRVLDAFSVQPAGDVTAMGGGAADLGSFFGRLWNGALNVLRVGTYWQMKNRAGVVGKKGLGPLLGLTCEKSANLRIHLLGHSFGARLVSYSLAGLPASALTPRSPVKSLFLLQGAFSHFAFANALPFDASRKGDLAGMTGRVDGPLLTTFSLFDLAVGAGYPAAAILAGDDASMATDLMYRWEGMGHDGAQAVDAAGATLADVHTIYPFVTGKWINLDGNQVIKNGGPPAGAHGDIIHPETAWAALAAAKVAGNVTLSGGQQP